MPEHQEAGPVRIGMKVHPPTILVEYVKDPTKYVPPPQQPQAWNNNHKKDQFSTNSASKLRRKTVRLHNLGSSKDSAQDVASALSLKFPIHFGGGVVNRAQLVGLIAKLQGSLSDGPQTSIDNGNIIDKDITIYKDSVVIEKDKKAVGDDAISNDTAKQPREQQLRGGDVVSDDVRVNLLPALIATTLGGEQQQQQQRKEGSEDSAAEVKSSLGDPSETREEMGDSLMCTTGDDGDSRQSKAATATMAPQATSVDMSDGGDLNRISEAELTAAKSRMDVMFQRNQLLPGELGYTHDVRRDFSEPEEDCDWDED